LWGTGGAGPVMHRPEQSFSVCARNPPGRAPRVLEPELSMRVPGREGFPTRYRLPEVIPDLQYPIEPGRIRTYQPPPGGGWG